MSYANRVLGSIPYGTLIGAPMTAAVEAQALAAQSSVNFIRTVGFKNPDQNDSDDEESTGWGDTRYVEFTYTTRETDEDTPREAKVNVPLLTIVPIPYLRIDDMTIDFTSKITEEMIHKKDEKTDVKSDSSLNVEYKKFLSPVKVGFKSSLSVKHSSSSSTTNRYKTEHTININVRAVQDDIPGGMSRVLDLLESGIKEKESDSES